MRRLILASALAMGSACLNAQTTTTTLDAVSGVPEIDKTTQTEDLRFHNDGEDRMTVPVRFSGAGPYQFLVDTGADRSAVSREIVARLNKAVVETLALAEVNMALDKIAVTPRSTTPEQYRVLIARDAARWKAVATAANIKLE